MRQGGDEPDREVWGLGTARSPNPDHVFMTFYDSGHGEEGSPFRSHLQLIIARFVMGKKQVEKQITPELIEAAKNRCQVLYTAHFHSTVSKNSSFRTSVCISSTVPRVGEIIRDSQGNLFTIKSVFHDLAPSNLLMDIGESNASVVCVPSEPSLSLRGVRGGEL
jgi:hypothetical protein